MDEWIKLECGKYKIIKYELGKDRTMGRSHWTDFDDQMKAIWI